MKPADVSAVVLDYRTPAKTIACLRSIASEGIARVVLVENSADGGRSMTEMLEGLATLRDDGLQVHVIDEGRNLGFAAGVNRALAWIARNTPGPALLLNSDARLADGTLAGLINELESGADMVSPEVDEGGAVVSPLLYYNPVFALLSRRALLGAVPYLAGACILVARRWVRADLFDEDFFFYGEDVELGIRLARMNARCRVAKNCLITHEVAGSARKGSLFYEYHINRGHWLLACKLASGGSRVAAFAGRGVCLPLRALVRCSRLRNSVPLRGFLLATLDAARGKAPRFVSTSERA